MKMRISELDGETMVLELEVGDTGPVVDMMDARENGFAVFGEAVPVPLAVIDGRLLEEGWFTSDHLLAIEAHELGHLRKLSEEEEVAEREGIRLLTAAGQTVAAAILIERGIV